MPTATAAATLTARPTKLRNGSWGATVDGSATAGQKITIRASSGKSWDAVVSAVVWSGNGVTIVATRSDALVRSASTPASAAPLYRPRGRRTGCSCGSIEDHPRASDCRSCQHDY